MTDELDIPNVMPLLLENTTVPDVAVWVPAAAAMPPPPPEGALAVMVPLFRPNVTLLLLAKVRPPNAPEVVPADTLRLAAAAVFADTVTVMPAALVDPDSVMLLPPASTNWLDTVPVLPDVLPPDTPTDMAGAPMLMVPPLVEMLTMPVPLTREVAGTEAMTDPLLLLNVTPFELAKFRVWNVEEPPLAENAWLLWEVR